MNILEFLKNGSGIHIKEKNKGKFTSYCGGKVTSACIAKGKNSSDPAVRKRATFAANARKWKHLEGGIIKAEDGLSTSLLGLLPGVGTYLEYKEFEKNPNWRTGLSLGVSALGDVAMLTGAGAIIKGISTANKARKILGTAGKTANIARQLVWNQASKLKRESDAVNSLTLMNAPTNKILERLASKNLAKKSYEEALKNDETALKIYLTAASNPALNFKSSQFTPLIYTNPGFHAVSLAIKYKKEGGIIKSLEGSKINWEELAVNTGTNLLSVISKNKLISYDAQAKKALNQIDYDLFVQASVNNAIQKMNEARDQWKQSYLNGDTLDRSFESDAVMGTLQHQFMAPEIAKGKQTLNNVNALVDAEAKALKGDNWSNVFGNVVQTGLGTLGNYLGLKKTTTTPLINSRINDFSSGYNLFTKNSVLYNPDKFWNL